MNSEESILKIKVFYKDKSFAIKSKDLISLKELEKKSFEFFKINTFFQYSAKFLVKDNINGNDNKIYISSEDDIIKNSIEKDQQNLIIELVLTFENDKDKRDKTLLMNKDIYKSNKSINDNNIKNEKNTFKIICNEHICFEGNMNKIIELNKEINEYKKYKEDYLKLKEEMQNLRNDLENYKKAKSLLEEEKIVLLNKINNIKKDSELIIKKKSEYIKELEEKINKTKNKSLKEEKMIDNNIQRNLEKPSSNEKNINSNINATPIYMEEDCLSLLQNIEDSNYNNKIVSIPLNSNDEGILRIKQNLNDNLNNINIDQIKNDKKREFLSRNEEIKKDNDIANLNPKTDIKKKKVKKLDIDTINKIRKQCSDKVKNYSDEKIQKILDDNGGNYPETLTDIMCRLSKILYN